GVMLSHRNLIANAFQTRHWLPNLKEGQERVLAVVPFAHVYGMTTAMNVAINNFPGVRKFGLRSINACISGAAPLPVEVQETFEKLTKGKLVEGYGLT